MPDEKMSDGKMPDKMKTPENAICFPVTKEAADKALLRIAEDPLRMQILNAKILKIENPRLHSGLIRAEKFFEPVIQKEAFSDGAVFAYIILKEQAILKEKKIPEVSNDVVDAHTQDEITLANNLSDKKFPRASGAFETTNLRMEEISKQDPEFWRAIRELTKYRTDQNSFRHGAVFTYSSIRKMEEAQELGKKFNL
jgi:hypothetical protein